MCLDINKKAEKKLAKSDITCYKILLKKDGKLVTYFREVEVELGKTYESELFVNDYNTRVYDGLHSFKYFLGAVFVLIFMIHTSKTKLVKCVIPKGSFYYEGWFSSVKSFASDRIKYL